jgi:Resolvase, N terminal domain
MPNGTRFTLPLRRFSGRFPLTLPSSPSGGDGCVPSALDALEVHAQFTKRGIGLHLIDLGGDIANGLSEFFYTIAVAFAEAERDRIRERVIGTKADQKKARTLPRWHSTFRVAGQ